MDFDAPYNSSGWKWNVTDNVKTQKAKRNFKSGKNETVSLKKLFVTEGVTHLAKVMKKKGKS